MAADRTPTDLIQSLQRGLRVLEHVVAAGRPVTTEELAQARGLVTAVEEVHAAPNAGRYLAGTTHLPHLTAVGHAILAAQPDDRVLPGVRVVRALARERDELFDEDRLLRDLVATAGAASRSPGGTGRRAWAARCATPPACSSAAWRSS